MSKSVDPDKLIRKYYDPASEAYEILTIHSRMVTAKALDIVDRHPEWHLDRDFVEEAAMLHDVGIFLTNAPSIDCHGSEPYIRHGVLGAELLREREGLPRHALVCERHTGTGLTLEEILREGYPLPHREMVPLSLEEQIICFADCFYSKSHTDRLEEEKSIESLRKKQQKYGEDNLARFDAWCTLFL